MDKHAPILIVDDDRSNINVLGAILADHYEIIVALNGEQALKLLETTPQVSLVLLDIQMPGIDGFEVCQRMKAMPKLKDIPVIFITASGNDEDERKGLILGAVDYITKPFSQPIVELRVKNCLELEQQRKLLSHYNATLEETIKDRTKELVDTQNQLRHAIGNLSVTIVSTGVYWLQIPEANLFILCGCPAEVVKHLMRQGLISTRIDGNISYETGPNVILLSDSFVQNGNFSNLTEFPILQMQYRQGMLLPNHPNNTGVKPMIMGDAKQLEAQLKYIQRGHYGLLSESELIEAGVSADLARQMMKVKRKFAFGKIKSADELIEKMEITAQYTEIRNGAKLRRIETNKFEFFYRDQTVVIDLNLKDEDNYSFPYTLDYHNIPREYFSVIHSGEGDGWDMNRPSMSSILQFQGKIYLVDAPPNITFMLEKLGIDISEVDGLFHTHIHDDHFAGLPNLILSGYRIKYFATAMVRASASKKLAALLSLEDSCLFDFFDVHDLVLDQWNNCSGLDVRPLYSPHPVDNNCFIFRAQDKSEMKTYAHFADLSSFKILDGMVGSEENDLSEAFINKVKADYLINVDVKKIDIGGGLIHGEAEDFIEDKSTKILMAHTARPLTNVEKEIGSTAPFGSLETLIESGQDYLRRQAFYSLRSIFPSVPVSDLNALLIAPIILINPGAIIRQKNKTVDHVDMILTGVAEYIQEGSQKPFTLSSGSLIGATALFSKQIPGTWRASSHVKIIRFSNQILHALLKNNQLYDHFAKQIGIIGYLLTTGLFGEKLSFVLLLKIAISTKTQILKAGESLNIKAKNTIFLVKSGGLVCSDQQIIKQGEFVGEQSFFDDIVDNFSYLANEETELYVLEDIALEQIPIVYWKLLERFKKQKQVKG